MSGHTAGPWKWHSNGNITATDGTKIAYTHLEDKNTNHNTKLIAAAPDMLETIIGLKKALSRMIDKYNPDSLESEWIGNANEVILKAKGERK